MEANHKKIFPKILAKITEAEPDTYIIFYKETCPYCRNALQILRESGVHYKGYNINKIGQTQLLLDLFNQNKNKLGFDPAHRTIPLIFYNGKFIGGRDELVTQLKSAI
jgi:glutaredoxin